LLSSAPKIQVADHRVQRLQLDGIVTDALLLLRVVLQMYRRCHPERAVCGEGRACRMPLSH
jgi:hypothetical protein